MSALGSPGSRKIRCQRGQATGTSWLQRDIAASCTVAWLGGKHVCQLGKVIIIRWNLRTRDNGCRGIVPISEVKSISMGLKQVSFVERSSLFQRVLIGGTTIAIPQ